jgi:pyruvate,water dikinase
VRRGELDLWLDGWSQSLAEVNFLRTGYRADGLLDVYYVTDEDIEERRGQAAKINANVDAAQPLKLKRL